MNRTILLVADVSSAPSLLLMDSAVKGTTLLALAAIVAIILRRDSAATRHLVWLLAMVAMLVVPVWSRTSPGLPLEVPSRQAIAAASILAFAGIGYGLHGIALWPAVVLHAVMSIWCVTCLRRTPLNVTMDSTLQKQSNTESGPQ